MRATFGYCLGAWSIKWAPKLIWDMVHVLLDAHRTVRQIRRELAELDPNRPAGDKAI